MRKKELSIDIESLGTKAGAVVLSIAATPFDVEDADLPGSFYVRVSLIDGIAVGLSVDRETALWWSNQRAAREALETDVETAVVGVREALERLRDFVQRCCVERPRVWMKGPSFDGVLLRAAADAAGVDLPWSYGRERCVRTIGDDVPEPDRLDTGKVAHSAKDDAEHQARWVQIGLRMKRVEVTVTAGNSKGEA